MTAATKTSPLTPSTPPPPSTTTRTPSAAVRDIVAALDRITIDDLKLPGHAANGSGHRDIVPDEKVQYLKIHACEDYTIGAFVFGRRGEIPLHNHPGMTVCSRVIYGETRVTAYDFVDREPKLSVEDAKLERCAPQRARLVRDEIVFGGTGNSTSVLYPDGGGNVHRLSAVTACAVLDVQAPPYAIYGGRACHYFEIVDSDSDSDSDSDDDDVDTVDGEGEETSPRREKIVLLRETLAPLDFSVERLHSIDES